MFQCTNLILYFNKRFFLHQICILNDTMDMEIIVFNSLIVNITLITF